MSPPDRPTSTGRPAPAESSATRHCVAGRANAVGALARSGVGQPTLIRSSGFPWPCSTSTTSTPPGSTLVCCSIVCALTDHRAAPRSGDRRSRDHSPSSPGGELGDFSDIDGDDSGSIEFHRCVSAAGDERDAVIRCALESNPHSCGCVEQRSALHRTDRADRVDVRRGTRLD